MVVTSPSGSSASAAHKIAGQESPSALKQEGREALDQALGLSRDDDADGAARKQEKMKDARDSFPQLPPATAPPGMPPPPAGSEKLSKFHDATKAALLDAAALTDPEDRETRDLALSSLQALTANPMHKRAMWEDTERLRPVLLARAQSEDSEDHQGRCFALGCLWNLAADAENRKPMWYHAETQEVLVGAAQSEDSHVLELALGVLWNLSPKAANAEEIWDHLTARKAILAAASSEDPDSRQARAFAMAALQNLAEAPENRPGMWADKANTRAVLLKATELEDSEDKDLRGRAVGALMNLSVDKSNKQDMWDDIAGVRQKLIDAASLEPGTDDKSFTCGLAGIWSLAVDPKNRVPMWREENLKAALITAASLPKDLGEAPQRARERALGTLQYLSTDADIKKEMWEDLAVRGALIESARSSNALKLRSHAFGSLWNLSSLPENQTKLWQDEDGARAVVIDAAKDPGPGGEEVQERALAILWNISAAAVNKPLMWEDQNAARAAVLTSLRLTLLGGAADGAEGRLRRQYAFGTLRNLSDEVENRADMWADEDCRAVLVQGGEGSDAGDELSSKRAIKSLCALAYEPKNSQSVWQDEKGARAHLIRVSGTSKPDDQDLWLCTCRAVQALSVESANKAGMWSDLGLREALVLNGGRAEPEEHKARICALSTLKNVSTEPANMEGIWNDTGARKILLTGAQPPNDAEDSNASRARAISLGALRNIAASEDNKPAMWSDQGIQEVVLVAAEITDKDITPDLREAREHALATLRHLAVHSGSDQEQEEGVQRPLWMDCERAHEALLAASKLPTKEPGDRKARDYAVAALRSAVC